MTYTYDTLADIVNATILRVGQVAGIGVQTYAEDIIAEAVKHKFDVLFDKFEFPEYMNMYTGTLDASGRCDEDLQDENTAGLMRFQDIKAVWYENDEMPLKRFTSRRNSEQHAIAGRRPAFIDSIPGNRVFRVLPFGNAGDTVYVRHKMYPAQIIATTELKMDRQALILGAAFDYLSDDNANPAAIEKMRNMFNQRITQLQSVFNQHDLHDPRAGGSYQHEESGYQTIG